MNLGDTIFLRLKNSIDLKKQPFVVDQDSSLFGILVAIILSQNTNDKNSIRAFENLKKSIGLDPKRILDAGVERVMEAIRVSGLYKEKAERIVGLANLIVKGLDLNKIMDLPVEKARKELMKIPGIGPKTADVFLALQGKETIGVDTHLARVTKRLGLVREGAKYEEIRSKMLEIFRGKNYDTVHRYFIALGRKWCTAKNPKCQTCPLSDICKFYKENVNLKK